MSVYLDYNASTPIDERVLDAMIVAYREYYGNADSRTHDYGQNASQKVALARKQVAALLGVQNSEIIFTSGATESSNMAVFGFEQYGIEHKKRHIITTALEHKAVLETVKHLGKKGFEIEIVNPDESGRINADQLLSKVREDTLLVSVQHVNNETGIIQPVQQIGDALWKTDTLFHIDAVQSCGKLVNEIKMLRYNMLSLSAHKMYGPQGVGALVLRRKNNRRPPLTPLVYGGGQEDGLRAGTLPVALIVGFGKACEFATNECRPNQVAYKMNKQCILDAIEESGVVYAINGDQAYCIDSTLNISFWGIDSEALMIATKQYCSISNGSACTSHDYSPSYVLKAMGLSEDRIESAIRLSWGSLPVDPEPLRHLLSTVKSQQ